MIRTPAIVELDRATLHGQSAPLIEDVELTIGSGDCVQILGQTGQGKSVLLEVLNGQHRLASGTRRYPAFEREYPDSRFGILPRFALRLVSSEAQRQVSVSQASFYQARWHSLWTEPQTVTEFLSERQVLGVRPYEVLEMMPVRRDFAAVRARVLSHLELTGLEQRLVAQLSNGELRKLLLASAYLAQPRLLLLDDPFGGLAETARRQLTTMLRKFLEEGQSIVYTSAHDGDLRELSPRRFYMRAGRLTSFDEAKCADASPREVAVTRSLDGATAPSLASATPDPFQLGPAEVAEELPTHADPWLAATGSNAAATVPGPRVEVPVLRCSDVSVRMNGTTLLDSISWEVLPGQHWLVTGPNGSGKSTLLALLTGDHPQSYSNDIELLGTRLGAGLSLWERRRQIGYVAPEVVWHYPRGVTLRELLLSGFDVSIGMHRPPEQAERERCDHLLESFELSAQADVPLGALSEGTVRQGLLMRALVRQPKLILLDEPTQEIGSRDVERFLAHLDRIAAAGRSTIVLVTHHVDERPDAMTHHLRLSRGRVVESGPIGALPRHVK